MGRNTFITCDKCLTKVRKDKLAIHETKRCATNMKMVETKMGKITKCGKFTATSNVARHVKKCGECQGETKPEDTALTQHSDCDTRGGGSIRNPMEKYDWQASTYTDFINQTNREIIIINDKQGDRGKTYLAEEIKRLHHGTIVWSPTRSEMKYGGPKNSLHTECEAEEGRMADVAKKAGMEPEKYILRNVIVDLPRGSTETDKRKHHDKMTNSDKHRLGWKIESLTDFVIGILMVLENLKDGKHISSQRRIRGGCFEVCKSVNVMIMTNSHMVYDIAEGYLSIDRIRYKDISYTDMSCASSKRTAKYRTVNSRRAKYDSE